MPDYATDLSSSLIVFAIVDGCTATITAVNCAHFHVVSRLLKRVLVPIITSLLKSTTYFGHIAWFIFVKAGFS